MYNKLKWMLEEVLGEDVKLVVCKENSVIYSFHFKDATKVARLNTLTVGRVHCRYRVDICIHDLKCSICVSKDFVGRMLRLLKYYNMGYDRIPENYILEEDYIIKTMNIDMEMKIPLLLLKRLGYNSKGCCSGYNGKHGYIVLCEDIRDLDLKVNENTVNIINDGTKLKFKSKDISHLVRALRVKCLEKNIYTDDIFKLEVNLVTGSGIEC